ncbi:MAG: hypothetical protein V3S66_04270 [Desulfobacterales bacterium]
MCPSNSLSRRIKRHVTGPEQTFFAATSPGLEQLCLAELRAEPLCIKTAAVIAGGVQFKGRVRDCFMANLTLSTANRILMRMGAFKATNFRQLEKKLSNFNWELYLPAGRLPRINVTSRHSRLFHTAAISERFKISIARRLVTTPAGQTPSARAPVPQIIFVRVVNDRFTLSIDSSGDLLYKRGIKKDVGRAPLRETIAAGILTLAGYTGREPLLDPMCGSGTFAIEAAMQAQKIPAGWFRDFAFKSWPCFRPRQWAYIRRQSENRISLLTKPFIFASDRDRPICKVLQDKIETYEFSGVISISCRDFFDIAPLEVSPRPGLVVINPPYGLRMGDPDQIDAFFMRIYRTLKRAYRGWKLALIVPENRLAEMAPFPKMVLHRLHHGGLKLTLVTAKI